MLNVTSMNFHINHSRITTTILKILSINTCYSIISLIIQLVRILAHMDKPDHCFSVIGLTEIWFKSIKCLKL